MKALCRLGFWALGLLSLGSYFGNSHPLLDLLANFRVQFCLALALSALLLFLLRCRLLMRMALVLLAIESTSVLSWYNRAQMMAPAQARFLDRTAIPHLKVLLANVLFDNHRVEPLQQLIARERPDLVVLQEANDAQLGMMTRFREALPYHFRTRNLPYGLAVWSRLPILQPRFELLGAGELPTLSCRLTWGRRELTLFTTHLTSPIRRPAAERDHQLAAMAGHLRRHPADLVLGDFNVSMWSPHYQQFEAASGYSNCRHGFGVLASWPAQLPAWSRIPIDQCLTRGSVRVEDLRLGPNIGSDHLPVLLTLAE